MRTLFRRSHWSLQDGSQQIGGQGGGRQYQHHRPLTGELTWRADGTVTIAHDQEQPLDAKDVGYHQEPLCHHGCSYFVKLERLEAEQHRRTSPDQWFRKSTLESARIECGSDLATFWM